MNKATKMVAVGSALAMMLTLAACGDDGGDHPQGENEDGGPQDGGSKRPASHDALPTFPCAILGRARAVRAPLFRTRVVPG